MSMLAARAVVLEKGAMLLQTRIRFSSLVLAVLMSVGVVAGMIALRPPLTQTYYIQLVSLIAGAGLVVTLYNAFASARARHRAENAAAQEACADTQMSAADSASAHTPAVRGAVQEPVSSAAAEPPESALSEKSLDVLLDIAYEASEHAPLRAVAAYREALQRYPDDSYMPYLIIELSTLYKRLGNYDAALALFDEALVLPIITKNAAMAQEFERSRRSLAVVSHMLTARGTPTLPFGDVPKDLLAEADRRAELST